MWIASAVVTYLVLSLVAALVFFCALVVASRTDATKPAADPSPAERSAEPATERKRDLPVLSPKV